MPIPPCSWMHSSATRVPMRPMLYLAAESAFSRTMRSEVSVAAAALMTAERACSTSSSIGHAVLQRLEAADGHAELLAGAQVFQRIALRDLHGAQGLGAQRQQAPTDGLLQNCRTLPIGAQQRVRTDAHAVQ